MREKKELINFKAPIQLKEAFDSICDARGFTRTHGLTHIMHKFIIEMHKEVEQQNAELDIIQKLVRDRKKMIGFKEFIQLQTETEITSENDMPVGFLSDGSDEKAF